MIIRYTAPPTKYDQAPYKTLCILQLNDEGTVSQLFIQVSEDETNPNWISVEELVVKAFKSQFDNKTFIEECLEKISVNDSHQCAASGTDDHANSHISKV